MNARLFIFAVIAVLASCSAHALEYSSGYSGGNCSTCSWIAADGEIEDGDAQDLLDYIQAKKIDYEKLVIINSPGGDVAAALELGTLIRNRGMRVMVGRTTEDEPDGAGRSFQTYSAGVCASACVFVLMGGEVREIADEDSLVGVHQFAPAIDKLGSIASTTSSTQSVIAILQSYAANMDVNPTVLALASSTAPDDMRWLRPQDMERLNLLTSRNYYKKMATWSLQPAGSQLLARASQEQTNGRMTSLIFDCQYLHIGFQVPTSERIDQIAKSIRSAMLTLDGTQWSYPLKIANVAVRDQIILVSFVGGPTVLDAISQAGDLLNIDVGLPWVYMEEFGGPVFDLPTSNIADMAPHIRNSCR